MSIQNQAGADLRMLFSAALIGSGVGLTLGAAYLAGGMAQHAADHSRAQTMAAAAQGAYEGAAGTDYAEAPLRMQLSAAPIAPAVLRLGDAAPAPAEPGDKRARELECLTQAVYYEARGENPRGQFAVAQVVMNRVKHPAFPKSVCAVVFQGAGHKGCQFSFACDGSMRRGHETSAWNKARRVATRALAGAVIPDVGAATHFHTTAVAPAWGPQMRRVAQVGMHVFYRFGPRKAPGAPQVQTAVMTGAPSEAPELRLTNAVLEAPAAAPVATPAETAAAPAPAGESAAAKPADSAALATPATDGRI